jgi:hypothetical protein
MTDDAWSVLFTITIANYALAVTFAKGLGFLRPIFRAAT